MILGAWNDPKNANHFDLLKMEIENACLEADVDLSHTEIHVGSAEAARAIRLRSRGIGERASGSDRREGGDGDPTSGSLAPEVVSGKELMAALVDVHVGRALPPSFMPGIMFLSLLYGLAGPAARAYCGVPMFGATPASEFAAADVHLQRLDALELHVRGDVRVAKQEAVLRHRAFGYATGSPGEFFPPNRKSRRGVFQGGVKDGVFVVSVVRESAVAIATAWDVSFSALDALTTGRTPRAAPVVFVPRDEAVSSGRRMNLTRLFCPSFRGHALGLYFGAHSTHRLMAVFTSSHRHLALVSLTVFEAAAINEQVLETRRGSSAGVAVAAARLSSRGKRRRGRGRKVASEARSRSFGRAR